MRLPRDDRMESARSDSCRRYLILPGDGSRRSLTRVKPRADAMARLSQPKGLLLSLSPFSVRLSCDDGTGWTPNDGHARMIRIWIRQLGARLGERACVHIRPSLFHPAEPTTPIDDMNWAKWVNREAGERLRIIVSSDGPNVRLVRRRRRGVGRIGSGRVLAPGLLFGVGC